MGLFIYKQVSRVFHQCIMEILKGPVPQNCISVGCSTWVNVFKVAQIANVSICCHTSTNLKCHRVTEKRFQPRSSRRLLVGFIWLVALEDPVESFHVKLTTTKLVSGTVFYCIAQSTGTKFHFCGTSLKKNLTGSLQYVERVRFPTFQ